MPANLTPEYKEAERRYREAKTETERLSCLEYMLSVIPKHKGTDKLQGDLKRRISKLKEKLEQQSGGKKKGFSHKIQKEGAGAVALVGAPNTGKSSLLKALTGVDARVAEYPYTTLEPHPGMMKYENIQIQLVDFPPVCSEHTESWVFDLIKSCDVFLLLVDLAQGDPVHQLETTLELLERHYLLPVWSDRPVEPGHRVARRGLVVANKADDPDAEETAALLREMISPEIPILLVSALRETGLELLRTRIFELLKIIRVYSKAPGKPPDLESPFTIPEGSTVLDFASQVHHDFIEKLKFARVWGSSKFDGMIAKRDYVLQDGDTVELHI